MLAQRISESFNAARKSRDPRLDALASIVSGVKNAAIAAKLQGDRLLAAPDDMVLEVLSKMAKQRRESVAEYDKANRPDLAATELAELAVIEEFLPPPATDAEIDAAISAARAKHGTNTGLVMKEVMSAFKGRVDGKMLQARVKAAP